MENAFLREVAKAYVVNNGMELERFTFVFANRRSQRFFIKFLGQEYGKVFNKPLISPKMITINELFTELSGIKKGDPIELLYILYKHYAQLKGAEVESFDEFVHWGEAIIKDFDDIDKYLINAQQLFSNIKDLKDLDWDFSFLSEQQRAAIESFWDNFHKGVLSSKKEFFISVWSIMITLYTNFRETLIAKGIGYEGLVYRDIAQRCKNMEFNTSYVFIGFNSPNMCERALYDRLQELDSADFYWDFYGTLLTNRENSAGDIIRKCVADYPSKYSLNYTQKELPKVKVIGVPSGVGQAFAVREVLNEIAQNSLLVPNEIAFNSAVVLPKEELLIPVINSIPACYSSINVTMGFPISSSTLISFMNLVADLQSEVRVKGGKSFFYHKQVVALLSHEFFRRIGLQAGEESELLGIKRVDIKEIKLRIFKENRIYIEQGDELLNDNGGLMSTLFRVVTEANDIAEYQIEVLKRLERLVDALEREYIYEYYLQINRLKSLQIPMEGKTYFKFISRITSSISVPFRGEPLRGLQVMGSLEIRSLDFDNIIYINVNEGVFPAASVANSLIPYNLRFGFGMPTYEMQDGMAAYHFYRSITRARNVYLIYDTRSEGINTGEVSRYVKQLKYHFNLPIEEVVAAAIPTSNSDRVVEVVKTPEVMQKLMDKYVNSNYSALSASAVNNYIACKLKFYFENLEGVTEEDEIAESVEANTFGTLYHNVMARIYDRYKFEQISRDILVKEAKSNASLEQIIHEEFCKLLNINEITGQNIIIVELIKKYVALTLKEDEKYIPFTYMASEERYRYSLKVNDNLSVNFKAFIDRIDMLDNGTIRVIDYKTGTIETPTKNTQMNMLFSDKGKFKALFQLYLYALIVLDVQKSSQQLKLRSGNVININVDNESSNLELVVYPLKKIKSEGIFSHKIELSSLDEFRALLNETVAEIFNTDVPFTPNIGCTSCKYCNFSALCGA